MNVVMALNHLKKGQSCSESLSKNDKSLKICYKCLKL